MVVCDLGAPLFYTESRFPRNYYFCSHCSLLIIPWEWEWSLHKFSENLFKGAFPVNQKPGIDGLASYLQTRLQQAALVVKNGTSNDQPGPHA